MFSISQTSLSVASAGATATLSVTTEAACAWTVTSGASFVTITSATSQTGSGSVSLTVAPNTGEARSATITIAGQSFVVNQAANDGLFGNWAGTITKGAGCPASLPASVSWTGVIQRNALGAAEFVVTAANILVVNQTIPLTVNGNIIQFGIAIDTLYTFAATLAGDRRSFSGTFTGGGCSGTWTGART